MDEKERTERQKHCDDFAEGVAEEVRKESNGVLVGWFAKVNWKFRRVEFTFSFGATGYSFPVEPFDVMFMSISMNEVFERVVQRVLKDTCPAGLAQRRNRLRNNRQHEPEIPIHIDQAGNRHHTLKAETGRIGAAGLEAILKRGTSVKNP